MAFLQGMTCVAFIINLKTKTKTKKTIWRQLRLPKILMLPRKIFLVPDFGQMCSFTIGSLLAYNEGDYTSGYTLNFLTGVPGPIFLCRRETWSEERPGYPIPQKINSGSFPFILNKNE